MDFNKIHEVFERYVNTFDMNHQNGGINMDGQDMETL